MDVVAIPIPSARSFGTRAPINPMTIARPKVHTLTSK